MKSLFHEDHELVFGLDKLNMTFIYESKYFIDINYIFFLVFILNLFYARVWVYTYQSVTYLIHFELL
ncbi:uncharacterized protein B0P05DRAFT_546657 [Gilbertella persicaria]|uniref:uncharacterized protein n=1 Tax=Gilbertella persicaria TaxID=101096 RepID=UPI00221F17EA|nr:uncharacterized protein B0P05DRAFT_546657 [Gilbertella persicaria]KAI8075853.1 hypothetical protein B0P05DRAFT_546657 [Gilbertella persicaria]